MSVSIDNARAEKLFKARESRLIAAWLIDGARR
jgi:hypothetical protein